MNLSCADRLLDLSRPRVMGVLNVTPDSFSDGGRHVTVADALDRARAMVAEGALVIDVGGESTRPGAEPVGLQQELDRVIPVIEKLHAEVDAVISIDTMKPEVMRSAVAAGAGLVNDVLALQSPGALQAVAQTRAAVCVMHMQGSPGNMQVDPHYSDVVVEVEAFLLQRAQACVDAGIGKDRIVIDPGFGFGKALQHNLSLLAALPRLAAHGYPVLAGLSRKSMLGKLLGRPVDQRLAGSLALATIAVQRGARIIRTHDVEPTCDAVAVAWAAA